MWRLIVVLSFLNCHLMQRAHKTKGRRGGSSMCSVFWLVWCELQTENQSSSTFRTTQKTVSRWLQTIHSLSHVCSSSETYAVASAEDVWVDKHASLCFYLLQRHNFFWGCPSISFSWTRWFRNSLRKVHHFFIRFEGCRLDSWMNWLEVSLDKRACKLLGWHERPIIRLQFYFLLFLLNCSDKSTSHAPQSCWAEHLSIPPQNNQCCTVTLYCVVLWAFVVYHRYFGKLELLCLLCVGVSVTCPTTQFSPLHGLDILRGYSTHQILTRWGFYRTWLTSSCTGLL